MNLLTPTPENLKRAADCVTNGGIIVAPSDTNLALTLDPWNGKAIERAFSIKNRPGSSPLTLFISDPEDWHLYADAPNLLLVSKLINAFWPGPLNVILPRRPSVPERLVCGGDTVAIGCLAHPVWRAFMNYRKRPVAMTSANLSGQADGVLVDLRLASEQIGDKVDFLLKAEVEGTTRSSTIIDLTAEPAITRLGDISAADIFRATGVRPRMAVSR